jgi:predicted transcriptional regulator
MERRTRYDIYSSILDTLRRRGFTGITRISYGAGLPVDRAKTAVAFLVERDLIKEEEYGGTKGYRLTARGGESLQALKTVIQYLGPEEDL